MTSLHQSIPPINSIPSGFYRKVTERGSNPRWDMCFLRNPSGTSKADLWCQGCNVTFIQENTSRFPEKYLPQLQWLDKHKRAGPSN
ncbi:hypothetical protein GEMRC1_013059 [Eukaryota sp. GEM-RC1]